MTGLIRDVLSFIFMFSVFKNAEPQSQESCTTPSNKEGRCIPIKECKPMVDFLTNVAKPIPTNIIQNLVMYTCGYKNGTALVCCPPDLISFNETGDQLNLRNHRNSGLIPTECGLIDMTDRIRNGENAQLNEFPWMAALMYNTSRGPQFNCGGTVINERYILTAAHCIVGTPDPLIAVRVGEYDTSSDVDCQDGDCLPPVQDLTVEKLIPHPEYNVTFFANDIGLIRVSKINLSVENAKTVCLPIREEIRNQKFSLGIVTGWGFTGPIGKKATILQKVVLPIHNLTTCTKAYEKLPRVNFSDKQLCAGGTENKDSCGGDSGGPLHSAAYLDEDTRYVQRGLVSIGHAYCGTIGFPSIFTKVAPYVPWILDTIAP